MVTTLSRLKMSRQSEEKKVSSKRKWDNVGSSAQDGVYLQRNGRHSAEASGKRTFIDSEGYTIFVVLDIKELGSYTGWLKRGVLILFPEKLVHT